MVSQFVVVCTALHHEFFVLVISWHRKALLLWLYFNCFRQFTFLESQKVVLLRRMENCKWAIGWPQYVLPILCTVMSCLWFC